LEHNCCKFVTEKRLSKINEIIKKNFKIDQIYCIQTNIVNDEKFIKVILIVKNPRILYKYLSEEFYIKGSFIKVSRKEFSDLAVELKNKRSDLEKMFYRNNCKCESRYSLRDRYIEYTSIYEE